MELARGRWCKTHEFFNISCNTEYWFQRGGQCVVVDAVVSEVSALVIEQVPCDNCTLGMIRSTTCDDGSVYGGHPGLPCDEHCPVPCSSCGGSGTTWPEWTGHFSWLMRAESPPQEALSWAQVLDAVMEKLEDTE